MTVYGLPWCGWCIWGVEKGLGQGSWGGGGGGGGGCVVFYLCEL